MLHESNRLAESVEPKQGNPSFSQAHVEVTQQRSMYGEK